MVNRGGLLSGEEAAVSIRDVFLFPHHLQHNTAASNWGGHLFYWVWHEILGSLGLFYGRFAKAIQMAWIAPLFFLVQTRVLKTPKTWAFAFSILVMLLPGVVNYSWMSSENGNEVTFGLLAIFLAAGGTLWTAVLSVAVAAFAALTYGAGLSFAPVVFYILAQQRFSFMTLRQLKNRLREPRNWFFIFGMLLIFGAVLMIPLFWWKNPARIILGGGEIPSVYGGWLNLKQWFRESWLRGGSYYYYCKYPAFSSLLLLLPVLGGMACTFKERRGAWIWLGFLASLALYVLAGRESGMRRGIPTVIFLSFFMVLGFSSWLSLRKRSWKKQVAAVVVVFAIVFSFVQYTKVLKRFAHGGELWTDYDFVILPGETMLSTLHILLDQRELLKGKHWDGLQSLVVRDYEPDRVFAMMYFVQQAEGLQSEDPLTEAQVLEKIKIQHPPKNQ